MNEHDWRHTYIRKNHLIVCQQMCETLEEIGRERHWTLWCAVAFTIQHIMFTQSQMYRLILPNYPHLSTAKEKYCRRFPNNSR